MLTEDELVANFTPHVTFFERVTVAPDFDVGSSIDIPFFPMLIETSFTSLIVELHSMWMPGSSQGSINVMPVALIFQPFL